MRLPSQPVPIGYANTVALVALPLPNLNLIFVAGS
jgi:hypothetical protein